MHSSSRSAVLSGGKNCYFFVIRDAFVGMSGSSTNKQRVLAFFVLVVVINTFIFHQAADEIKIRLPILYAIIPLAVRCLWCCPRTGRNRNP